MQELDPSDPPRVGPYTLLGRLGAGGMGSVFLGRSAGGRTVAVKLVRPELADDPGFRARFRAEVSAARAVPGAFTAPVVDSDADAPVPWMATAFVPGISLHRAVTIGGPLPDPALRALVAGIAEALTNIHAAGLTHRDLKPGNVLLALDGPHVIDFGIARAADGTVLTAPGTILGTPSYMSPEQALGHQLTPASDMFSLGATLVFAARGSGPFGRGQPLEILRRVVREEPDLDGVTDGLRPLVTACLAKNPADRPTPRQIVEVIRRSVVPVVAGTWLPPVLTAAIEQAAAVMGPFAQPVDGPAAPGFTPPPGPESDSYPLAPPQPLPAPSLPALSPPSPSASAPSASAPSASAPGLGQLPPEPTTTRLPRPSRRGLLLGLTGGTLALAGGAALALSLRGGTSPNTGSVRTGSASPASASSGSLTDPSRSLATDVVAAEAWTVPMTEGLNQVTGAGDTVIAVSAKHIWAFDRATGHPRWGPLDNSSDPSNTVIGGNAVAVGDGMVFAVGNGGPGMGQLTRVLRGIDLATGNVAWSVGRPDEVLSLASVPGMLNGLVYVTGTKQAYSLTGGTSANSGNTYSSDAFVWAVDPAARQIRWDKVVKNAGMTGAALLVPSAGTCLLWTSSNLDRSAPRISGLDAGTDGRTLWDQPAPGGGGNSITSLSYRVINWHDGPHCWAGGFFLYLADHLYAVDPANGQLGWQSAGKVSFTAVAASPDGATVYAAGPDFANQGHAQIAAFDARTGEVRWAGSLPLSLTGLLGIQCADGNVYVWANARLWALDAATGSSRWRCELNGGDSTLSSPIPLWAGGGQVYGTTDAGLVAIRADGRPAGA